MFANWYKLKELGTLAEDTVDLIYQNPYSAEIELKKYDIPEAKVYQAYLYMTDKVKKENKQQEINALMQGIIKTLKDVHKDEYENTNFVYKYRDTYSENYDFNSLDSIFAVMEQVLPYVPGWLVTEHPFLSKDHFGPYYSSNRDCFIPSIKYSNSIFDIPEVGKLQYIAHNIRGDIEYAGGGSLRHSFNKSESIAEALASLAPIYYTSKEYEQDGYWDNRFKDNLYDLRIWANFGIYNKKKYKEFIKFFDKAQIALTKYYIDNFNLSAEDAQRASFNALSSSLSNYIGSFVYNFRKRYDDFFYKSLTYPNAKLEEIKELLQLNQYSERMISRGLKFAVLNNQSKEIIDYLIKKGAKTNEGNESALMMAIENHTMVKYLIDKGADVNYENAIGKTALHYAAQYQDVETAKLLVNSGANLNKGIKATGWVGNGGAIWDDPPFEYKIYNGSITPLMYAARSGNIQMVKFLVESGADISLKDDEGQTALEYSQSKHVSNYLKEKLGVK